MMFNTKQQAAMKVYLKVASERSECTRTHRGFDFLALSTIYWHHLGGANHVVMHLVNSHHSWLVQVLLVPLLFYRNSFTLIACP